MINKVKLPIQSENILKIKTDFEKDYPLKMKKFRESLRWSIRDMAKVMGTSPQSVWNKENGKFSYNAFESYVMETALEQFNNL